MYVQKQQFLRMEEQGRCFTFRVVLLFIDEKYDLLAPMVYIKLRATIHVGQQTVLVKSREFRIRQIMHTSAICVFASILCDIRCY